MKSLLSLFLLGSLSLSAAPASSFFADSIDGERVSLAQYLRENRKCLVAFWATWCGPCIKELKTLQKKMAADPSVQLDVVTVNVDTIDTLSGVKPMLRLHQLNFPVLVDSKAEILSRFSSDKSLPFSVLLNSKGEIEMRFVGFHEDQFEQIKKTFATRS